MASCQHRLADRRLGAKGLTRSWSATSRQNRRQHPMGGPVGARTEPL
jgi:hypothetical protein